VAALSVVLAGVGAYLLYEAVKNPAPAPITKAIAAAKVTTKGG
jgi:hypothetical protein